MNFLNRSFLPRCFMVVAAFGALAVFPAQALEAAPRNIQFSNLSTERGLSSEFVQDLVQDRRGYVWIATQAGLNRFDGHDVRVYEHRVEDQRSLSHSFVRSLHLDDQGKLWIGTNRGVNSYDPLTDSFDRRPFGSAVTSERVRKITQDSSGTYWIGLVDSGLIGVDPQSGRIDRYVHDPQRPDSLPNDHIIDILEDSKGELWIGTDGGGLARLDRNNGRFDIYRHDPRDPVSLSDNHIRSMFEDSEGRLWLGTEQGGLNRRQSVPGEFVRYQHDPQAANSIGSGQVAAVFQDADGALWVGTEDGLSEWRPASDSFVTYRSDPADRMSLIGNSVNVITQDASGVLWFGTNGGVSSWNYVSDTFQHFTSAEDYLKSDVVTSIAETSDGIVWVATYGGGLSRLDLAGGAVRHYRHDPDDATSLSDDRVMTVYADHEDTVWVGTRSKGLCRLNPDGSFTRFQSDPGDERTLSGNAVTRVFRERNGTLWVGVFGGGLNRMHWRDGQPEFERFANDPDDASSLSGNRVLAMYQDKADTLWIGTEGAGLNRFDADTNTFERIDVEEFYTDDGSNPVSGTPWEIHESRDGTLWIGTLGQGLLRWSAEDRNSGEIRFQRFGSADGLAAEIYGIVEGSDGELWLSSSRGLFRFDPAAGSVRKFDRSNGLRSNEFNQGARLGSRSGRMMFGGTNGLLAFYPASLPHNDRAPEIDLVASSRTQMLATLGEDATSDIELGYMDPFVSFDFVALDFTSPDKNAYRFRLDGYDTDWTDARGYRRAVYSNLPTGNYTFEVQASNSDGVWNLAGVAMNVRVIPPPWRTGWAYLGYALLVAGIVFGLMRRQERNRQRDAELRARLEQLVSARTLELAERNDELTQLNQRFQQASVTDQLTGLRNRRFVDQFIEGEVSIVKRRHVEDQTPMSDGSPRDSSKLLFVMMIDLDGFKPVNDTYGHHAGDDALVEVKDRLVDCCRASDVVVRWGGDEFLIVGRSSTFDGTKELAEKVRVALAAPGYDVGRGRTATLSASMGISAIPFVEGRADFGGWEQIVAIADHGAYLSKSNGRNAWVSIRGTERMDESDFVGMKENVQALVDDGKLIIDSSVEEGICLDSGASVPRSSVG